MNQEKTIEFANKFLQSLFIPGLLLDNKNEVVAVNKQMQQTWPDVDYFGQSINTLFPKVNWGLHEFEIVTSFPDLLVDKWVIKKCSLEEGYSLVQFKQLSESVEMIQKMNVLTESLPGYISWIDKDLTYLGINGKLARTYGLNPDELIGKKVGYKNLEESREFKEIISDFMQSTKKTTTLEYDIHLEGKAHTLLLSLYKYNYGENAVIVAIDITEQKEVQRTIYEQEIQLRNSAKLSALGELSATMAHEINGPLTVISGAAAALGKLLEKEEIPKAVDLVLKIQKMEDRVEQICLGLRKFARGDTKDVKEQVRLSNILDDTLELVGAKLGHRKIKIDIQCPEDCSLYCHQIQLSQVLLNFLNNSADAIENLDEKWIKVDVVSDENFWNIHIVDSGCGIPPEVEAKIFHPYFTTKAVGKGTGIGLDISRKIIHDHGGNITIVKEDKNTHFLLTLPR